MPFLQLPLSGDVSQTINPWTWFFNAVGSQLGLINVNLGRSSDPQLEQRILRDVGTYGRQLGQISDVLEVLLDHIKLEHLKPQERKAITAFRCMVDEVNRLKSERRSGRTGS